MGSSPAPKIPPPAPAFSDNGYPLAGERLGPAWVSAWCLLHQHESVSTEDLIELMVKSQISESTARSLLGMAAKSGHICGARYGGRHGRRVLAWRLATEADRSTAEFARSPEALVLQGASKLLVAALESYADAAAAAGCPRAMAVAHELAHRLLAGGSLVPAEASTESADMATDTAGAQAG